MKMSSTYQTLQHLLNPQQGVGVLPYVGIKMAEVNAEAKPLSFFLTNTAVLHHIL